MSYKEELDLPAHINDLDDTVETESTNVVVETKEIDEDKTKILSSEEQDELIKKVKKD